MKIIPIRMINNPFFILKIHENNHIDFSIDLISLSNLFLIGYNNLVKINGKWILGLPYDKDLHFVQSIS